MAQAPGPSRGDSQDIGPARRLDGPGGRLEFPKGFMPTAGELVLATGRGHWREHLSMLASLRGGDPEGRRPSTAVPRTSPGEPHVFLLPHPSRKMASGPTTYRERDWAPSRGVRVKDVAGVWEPLQRPIKLCTPLLFSSSEHAALQETA